MPQAALFDMPHGRTPHPVPPAWIAALRDAIDHDPARAREILDRAARELAGDRTADELAGAPSSAAALEPHEAARLRASEADHRRLYASILETAVDGIITIDEHGIVESMNAAALAMFGYAESEVVGQNIKMLMPSPLREDHDGYLARFRSTGERRIIGREREVRALRRDGSTFPMMLAVSEVRLDARRLFAGILHDVTEKRRMEEEFLQAQKMEAIGRLAGGIAHDFNNLLMGILGCCRMALGHLPPGSEARQHIQEITEAAERGSALTRQLLAFGRKRASERAALDLNAAVRASEAMLRQLLGEDVRLVVELLDRPACVVADAGQLTQVLMNLAVNARDAMPGGGQLTVRIDEVECPGEERAIDAPTRRYVSLLVRDTGFGMDSATLARAFEPFFTTKAVGHGTGLGLSTVYGIVQQHGGHVHIESRVGAGTSVRVHFPPAEHRAAHAAAAAAPPAPAPRGAETILLVEDERLVRASVRALLRDLGYRVIDAADPQEALAVCAQHEGEIDLLLTDIVMPGMSGTDLARKLLGTQPELRVLFMSAFPAETLVSEGRLLPGLTSLEKPFDERTLAAKVREVLLQPPPGAWS